MTRGKVRRSDIGSNRITIIAGITFLILLAYIVVFNFNKFDFDGYIKSLNDENYTGRTGHFPREFNDNLTPIAYSHEWPMLQGGGHTQILCKYKEIGNLWSKYDGKFEYTSLGIGEHFIQDGKGIKDSLPLVSLVIPGYGGELGSDWRIGVIRAIKGKGHDEQPWNHGNVSGIAVNDNKHQILYWIETW